MDLVSEINVYIILYIIRVDVMSKHDGAHLPGIFYDTEESRSL